MLTERYRRILLIALPVLAAAAGFMAGRFSSTPARPSGGAVIAVDESTSIIDPRRIVLPDGTSVPVLPNTPVSVLIEDRGAGATFGASGKAVSPSIRTSAGEQALKMDLQSGTPLLALPGGGATANAVGGGGAFDVKLSGNAGWFLIALGSIVFLCGPVGFLFGRKIGVGLSLVEAGGISACGLLLVAMGLYPQLASALILGLAGVGAVAGIAYVWKSRRTGIAAEDATYYDEAGGALLQAVHDLDTGDGSPGRIIKGDWNKRIGSNERYKRAADQLYADYIK